MLVQLFFQSISPFHGVSRMSLPLQRLGSAFKIFDLSQEVCLVTWRFATSLGSTRVCGQAPARSGQRRREAGTEKVTVFRYLPLPKLLPPTPCDSWSRVESNEVTVFFIKKFFHRSIRFDHFFRYLVTSSLLPMLLMGRRGNFLVTFLGR